MSQTQDVVNSLVAEVSGLTDAFKSHRVIVQGLVDHLNQLLQAAADAPNLDETNAAIANAQQALAEIHSQIDVLDQAVINNTPVADVVPPVVV